MSEPIATAPQEVEKPAGVTSFEEAAQNFTGKPFRRSKPETFILGTIFPGSYTAITSTDYGRIEEGPRQILTPTPIMGTGKQAKVIVYNFTSISTAKMFKEAIVSQPVVWTKYVYYREKEQEIRRLTKGFPPRPGEDKPHIPVYYENQIQWYRQQQDYYYDLLFESVSSTNKTGVVDSVSGEQ